MGVGLEEFYYVELTHGTKMCRTELQNKQLIKGLSLWGLVQSQVTLCGICGGQILTRIVFSSSSLVFLCQ